MKIEKVNPFFGQHYIKYSILLLATFFLKTEMIGQESYAKYIDIDANIVQEKAIIIQDEKFGTAEWNNIENTFWVNNSILFEINNDSKLIGTETATYNLELKVEFWYKDNPPDGPSCPSCSEEFILSIDYDPDPKKQIVAKAFKRFQDAHKLKITVLNHNIVGNAPALRLHGSIDLDRSYKFDSTHQIPPITITEVNNHFLTLDWMEQAGAAEYDVEWTFYHIDSEVGAAIENNQLTSYPNFDFLFTNNSTRVTVDATIPTYTVNLIYPEGYLFYRVRGAHYEPDGNRIFSQWSSNLTNNLKKFPNKLKTDWHQNKDLNFQSSVAFAEDGKNVPAVQYFDGTLRQRQGVVLSNSEQRTLYNQTVYDHHGRPAVQLLPAPGADNELKFDDLYAAVNVSTPFDKSHFDLGDCKEIPTTLTSFKGVGKYYSPQNPESNQGMHQYIPDANGYAYTITEYTPDLTGRVRRQSGVGATFRMGGGKETKYYYGKPAQKELDRLFGSDVGNYSHYLKNAVIDPNGQASISYIDAHGRVVATALAGEKPDNVLELNEGYEDSQMLEINLLNNQAAGNFSLVSSYKLLVLTPSNHSFTYGLEAAIFNKICTDSSFCYDCLYDLEITITDGACNEFNGNEPFKEELSNFSISDLLTECTSNRNLSKTIDFTNLPIGEYTITKKLTLSEAALNQLTEDFMERQDCLPTLEELKADFIADIDFSNCNFDCSISVEDRIGTEAEYIIPVIQEYENGGMSSEDAEAAARLEYQQVVAALESYCYNPDQCEIIYESLLIDVTPDGQYAKYNLAINQDPTSIFHKFNFQRLPNNSFYTDENGAKDFVLNTEGNLVTPAELTEEAFIENWKPSWADTLVKYFHPEYCLYEQWCLNPAYQASNEFDFLLEEIDFFQDALNQQLIKGETLNDPFFQPGGPGADCTDDFNILIAELMPDGSGILGFASFVVFGNIDCDKNFQNSTAAENNLLWNIFKDTYLSLKLTVKQNKTNLTTCPEVECIGNLIDKCPGEQTNWYKTKVSRFIQQYSPGALSLEDALLKKDSVAMDLVDSCSLTCERNADLWMAQLLDCDFANISDMDSMTMRDRLIAVCQDGCGMDYPFGASTTRPGESTSYGDRSFEDVILAYFPSANECEESCSPLSITTLNPYGKPSYVGPKPRLKIVNTCVCEKLTDFQTCYNNDAQGFDSFKAYLQQFSEYSLSQNDLDTLLLYCDIDNVSAVLPYAINIPAYLECNTCLTCDQVVPLMTTFLNNCSSSEFVDVYDLMARKLNQTLGFNLAGADYKDFYQKCQTNDLCTATNILCPIAQDLGAEEANPCSSELIALAEVNAINEYIDGRKALRQTFQQEYITNCTQNLAETFEATVVNHEYHYTLYYYDQAGNLVQTVPPNGVNPLTITQAEAVENHRQGTSAMEVYPNHNFLTKYAYNTLNQVVRQVSPDTKEKLFWYDKLGRLVLSQDGRQGYYVDKTDENTLKLRPKPLYSYTLYDKLGRIIEVGEKEDIVIRSYAAVEAIALDQDSDPTKIALETWVNAGDATSKSQITRTYYDEQAFSIPTFDNEKQDELRTNVASVTFEDIGDGDVMTYDYATHYSYDITGNVKTIVQEITALHKFGHGFKRMDYDYDYISGNVHAVYYQKGKPDQFTHRYDYDSNNRLIDVKSSFVETAEGGLLWDREAIYDYYLHGPLARMEIGHNRVQGCDYAYTLQGWIKGVNGSGLVADKDMGKDGATVDANQSVARDALGYTLSYFNGDYQQIGSTAFELQTNGSQLNDAKSLYNGNIRYMSIHNKALGDPMAFSYEYDQLHRIRQMTSVDNADLPNYQWGTSGNVSKYGMAATYDGNGNILHLTREGILPDKTVTERVNDLDYDYIPGTNLLTGTVESIDGEVCQDDEIVDYPITLTDSVKSHNQIFASSTINGSVDITFKTGQRICLKPGFRMDGIGGRFAALTQQVCEDTGEPISSMYQYDGNGNMILNGDSVMIEWTPYGKVRNVVHLKEVEGQSTGDDINIVVAEPITEDAIIQACSTIVANSTVIGANEVLFEAGEAITLLPGFQANPLGAGALTIRVLEDMIDCEVIVYDPPESTFGYDAAQNRVVKTVEKEGVLSKTFYIRDAQGNIMATYTERKDSLTWKEQHLYGSNRLGVIEPKVVLTESENTTKPHFEHTGLILEGWKRYELSNHLGNVLAVVNDRKEGIDTNNDRQADYYEPTILSASDYYPFGLEMPSRTMKGSDYRFGFNGKEADRNGEWGSSTHYDYGFRIYDPGIARFLSVDPLTADYPSWTSYAFAMNRVIDGIDLDGLEYLPVNHEYFDEGNSPSFWKKTITQIRRMSYNQLYERVTVAGNEYYNIGEHLYFSNDQFSNAGNRNEQSTFGSKVGIQLISNIDGLPQRPQGVNAPHWGTSNPAEIRLSQEQANLYNDCEGVCYAVSESRANQAYIDQTGSTAVNLTVSGRNIDHRIAATVGTNDPLMGYGAGGPFARRNLGTTIDNAGVWDGDLQRGAVLQIWHSTNPNDLFSAGGHSQIFRNYLYDNNGNISGIEVTDNSGGTETLLRGVYENHETILGVNLEDQ